MDKGAIKKFAVEARRKLISEITYKASLLGITENGIAEPLPQSTSDMLFLDIGTASPAKVQGTEVAQRAALVRVINMRAAGSSMKAAFESVVEEVAYTWFNRLIAIRFMEVNDYLPSGIRVLSSTEPSKTEPDIVTTPFDTDLDFTPYEKDRIVELKDQNKSDELFRLLFIKQCNKLREILPRLFEETKDYSELLLTLSFTNKDSVVYMLTHDIPEDDFNVEKQGQVEIIGWLYQYYNIEPKEQVFANLKKNIKISKHNIPAATQLFTPDWIVRYMVENSLGRLWIEGHPDTELKSSYKYYLDDAKQEPEVEQKLKAIREEYAKMKPEDIKIIDPCMGSGHILVYAFDLLMGIYKEYGFIERDAVKMILRHNLFGLDIDERAAQLAYFAVMMKARHYDRRFFSRKDDSGKPDIIEPKIYAITESNHIDSDTVNYFAKNDAKLKADIESIVTDLHDAGEYGSIISISPVDFDALYNRFDEIIDDINMFKKPVLEELLPVVRVAELLAQKYDVVVTNPPYMGSGGMGAKLSDYVKKNYPDSKSDLFAVFIERCGKMLKANGYQAMITQHAWMFLSSYEKLRIKLLSKKSIINMLHLGSNAFGTGDVGTIVQTVSFVLSNNENETGEFIRLIEYNSPQEKENAFVDSYDNILHFSSSKRFLKLPAYIVAYWISSRTEESFASKRIKDITNSSVGIQTGNNDLFLRLWHEVEYNSISFKLTEATQTYDKTKWYSYNKGGEYRKWSGNNDTVINWKNDGFDIKCHNSKTGHHFQEYDSELKFKPFITWTRISINPAFRYKENGFLSDMGGFCLYGNPRSLKIILALCNSIVAKHYLQFLAPTVNIMIGQVTSIPYLINKQFQITIENITNDAIEISNRDWDAFETSWDFKKNPLI